MKKHHRFLILPYSEAFIGGWTDTANGLRVDYPGDYTAEQQSKSENYVIIWSLVIRMTVLKESAENLKSHIRFFHTAFLFSSPLPTSF